MTVSFVGHARPMRARGERGFRSAIARLKGAIPAIKEACKVAFVLASLLTVIIALSALDLWIWVPQVRN
jgi:hypothetical protein